MFYPIIVHKLVHKLTSLVLYHGDEGGVRLTYLLQITPSFATDLKVPKLFGKRQLQWLQIFLSLVTWESSLNWLLQFWSKTSWEKCWNLWPYQQKSFQAFISACLKKSKNLTNSCTQKQKDPLQLTWRQCKTFLMWVISNSSSFAKLILHVSWFKSFGFLLFQKNLIVTCLFKHYKLWTYNP